ncbi:MAG: AAA family ATPase, partial [Spirochaetota bacterium]|nr:AAA family ATPase [Spirochaetota bacterium]
MKKLPLGIHTFKKLIENNYLYVDKTEYIYQIATEGSVYFLSRPRRFGKSLTISTLGSLFEGEKELFKGLYIYDQPWDWKKWPVLRFDFSIFSEIHEPEVLETHITETIQSYANTYNIILAKTGYEKRFQELLENLPDKAVILIDEYDKPILNYITDPVKANKAKEILKGFYTVIKGSDAHVRFAFLTGVTKFARISVFSGLNNLTDLTMKEAYADLCGYTEEELDRYFGKSFSTIAKELNLLEKELREKIREWYNGFRFSSNSVQMYNPISILNFISDRRFKAYWFETGTPTFLTQLMKKEGFAPNKLEELSCPSSAFSTYDVENLKALPILFQSGYLTIKEYQENRDSYLLGFPNREVRSAFLESLLMEFGKNAGSDDYPLYRLEDSLKNYDLESFFENLDILFAKIPYDIHLPYEKYWQSLFYMIFTLMGYYIEAEYRTSRGRIDAFISMPDRVYLFEFKLVGKKTKGAEELLEEA